MTCVAAFNPLCGVDLKTLGIPTLQEYTLMYQSQVGDVNLVNFDFYVAFCFYRAAAVLQGVAKRSLQGTNYLIKQTYQVTVCTNRAWARNPYIHTYVRTYVRDTQMQQRCILSNYLVVNIYSENKSGLDE